jgi:hypothetical protein
LEDQIYFHLWQSENLNDKFGGKNINKQIAKFVSWKMQFLSSLVAAATLFGLAFSKPDCGCQKNKPKPAAHLAEQVAQKAQGTTPLINFQRS